MFTDVYSNYVSSQIHETLFQIDYDMKLVPLLAEKLEQPNDTTYLITLEKGVKFHNGEELTADDVKFTYARVMDPATKSPRANNLTDAVESPDKIEAVDTHTVKITVKAPFGPFADRLSNGALQILNKKAVEAAGGDYAHKPAGTGRSSTSSGRPASTPSSSGTPTTGARRRSSAGSPSGRSRTPTPGWPSRSPAASTT